MHISDFDTLARWWTTAARRRVAASSAVLRALNRWRAGDGLFDGIYRINRMAD